MGNFNVKEKLEELKHNMNFLQYIKTMGNFEYCQTQDIWIAETDYEFYIPKVARPNNSYDMLEICEDDFKFELIYLISNYMELIYKDYPTHILENMKFENDDDYYKLFYTITDEIIENLKDLFFGYDYTSPIETLIVRKK